MQNTASSPRLTIVFALVFLAVALGPAPYPTGPVSFESYPPEAGVVLPGEVTRYQFSWNGIRAAEAEWEIKQDPEREGWICAEARGRIVGSAALIYRAHDSVSSCMKKESLKPDKYQVRIRESLDYYDMAVSFDHGANVARRWKKRPMRETKKTFEFSNVYCPVSLAVLIRSLPWKPGDERGFEVIDGNDRDFLILKAETFEEVAVPAGRFRALRLQPSAFVMPDERAEETSRYWEKQKIKDRERASMVKNFTIWIAEKPPRPFVKIRSDVYFGHVDMELVEISYKDTIRNQGK